MNINTGAVQTSEDWQDDFLSMHLCEWFGFADEEELKQHMITGNLLGFWDNPLVEVKRSKFDENKWIKVD